MFCHVFSAIIAIFLFSDVESLQPVISSHDGTDSIDVICNHRTMVIESNAKLIQTLTLQRKTGNDANFNKIAIYTPFLPTNTTQHVPPGRDWSLTFSGGDSVNGTNVQTIQISLVINKAECSDAGVYRCTAVTESGELHMSPEQNETRNAPVTQDHLVKFPHSINGSHSAQHEAGENVTISCVAHGPDDLSVSWKYIIAGSHSDLTYPDAGNATRRLESDQGPCVVWRYESNLSLTLQEKDNGVTYICVVSNQFGDLKKENLTIAVQINQNTAPVKHVTKADHRDDNVTKADHRAENVTKADHRAENVTHSDHSAEHVTNANHSAGHVTKEDHPAPNVTKPDYHLLEPVTKGDHRDHKTSNHANSINAPVLYINLLLALFSLFYFPSLIGHLIQTTCIS